MNLPKNANLPLIEIVMGSLLLHILALVTLGGITIYQNTAPIYVTELAAEWTLWRQRRAKFGCSSWLKIEKKSGSHDPRYPGWWPIEFKFSNIDLDAIETKTQLRIPGFRGEGAASLGPVRITERETLDLTRSAVNFLAFARRVSACCSW